MEYLDNPEVKTHPKNIFYYCLVRMVERASYYGIRTLLVLYMVGETIKLEEDVARNIYGFFMASVIFSQVLGAIIGDFFIGNKKSIYIGGIIMSIGAFCLCIPSIAGIYIGLLLISVGSGLFSPNLIAGFGKLYSGNMKLLDSGFIILYIVVNLGSFLGTFFIGYLGEMFGYHYGFMMAGIIMLLSLIPFYLYSSTNEDNTEYLLPPGKNKIFNILVALSAVALFWGLYELANMYIYDLQIKLGNFSSDLFPQSFYLSLESFFILPVSIFFAVLWNYSSSTPFFKLMVGFIFGSISFLILYLIPENPMENHIYNYLLFLLIFAMAEIHVAPIIYSILTKYSNPKYLTILIALSFMVSKLVSMAFGSLYTLSGNESLFAFELSFVFLVVIALCLIGYYWWFKKTSKKR